MDHGQDPATWAERSGAFGAAAAAYAAHRPGYAPAAIAWALAGAQRPVHEVLDLAAGTGALSRDLPGTVTAVEADPAMLAELGRRLPAVRRVVGRAEVIPLPDDSVDAVTVATAWHWFDEDAARREIARVLRPGGVLALLYDLDAPGVGWLREAGELARTSASSARPEDPLAPFDRTGWDGWAIEEERFPHAFARTAESLTATFGTQSHTLVVGPQERAEALARVRAFLDAHPETQGDFEMPMITLVVRARPVS